MNESKKQSFEFAAEVTRHLITLSTGFIALTITFKSDFLTESAEIKTGTLIWSWSMFIASILFGLFTFQTIAATLNPGDKEDDELREHEKSISIYKRNIRFMSSLQIITFFVAILLAAIFGICAV